jgi:small-conductance mechanosensitive channel/CRP-like cAMP-binding protein
MQHYPGHLIIGIVGLAATLLISNLSVNRLIKRKLKLSSFLFGAYALANIALLVQPGLAAPGSATDEQIRSFETLTVAAALINLFVVSLINPLRSDRVPDAFPSILQDAIVIGTLIVVATFVFEAKLLTTSAVGAVIVGFALQDTLGNAFAGLALQSEKPFRIGNWIRVGEFEGRVSEVTWRATKLRTKSGNFVVLPNNLVSQHAIVNYSEPAIPTRLELDVGASYLSTPGEVKAAVIEALSHVPRVLSVPAPDALLHAFDSSAVTYRVRFWVADYEFDDELRDEVRTAIFYAFDRSGIEIPWPIQVGYSRPWPETTAAAKSEDRLRIIEGVDLFAQLTDEQRRAIASATTTRMFGKGEAIVRQGAPGDSMFIICSGQVAVLLEPEQREIATIQQGGYFGEMSLLTGEPRTATVVSRGDAVVMEINAGLFRTLGAVDAPAVERIGLAAMTRRAELNQIREALKSVAVAEAPATFISRMRKFLGL